MYGSQRASMLNYEFNDTPTHSHLNGEHIFEQINEETEALEQSKRKDSNLSTESPYKAYR